MMVRAIKPVTKAQTNAVAPAMDWTPICSPTGSSILNLWSRTWFAQMPMKPPRPPISVAPAESTNGAQEVIATRPARIPLVDAIGSKVLSFR